MKTLTFDIETIPTTAALALPYPEGDRSPPANYKSEEAITKWYASDRAAWSEARIKECSLTPRLGRVLALGVSSPTAPDPFVSLAATEEDEGDLLRFFWQLAEGEMLAGFNSMSFDLPFLVTRSLILGVTIPLRLPDYLRRYTYDPHFDVRMALTGWDARATGTLGDWAAAFGLPRPVGSGAEVYTQFLAGDLEAVEAHCLSDVAATKALVERVGPAYLR